MLAAVAEDPLDDYFRPESQKHREHPEERALAKYNYHYKRMHRADMKQAGIDVEDEELDMSWLLTPEQTGVQQNVYDVDWLIIWLF